MLGRLVDGKTGPLVVPCHDAHFPALWRVDKLRGDHPSGFERLCVQCAGFGIGTESMRHVTEDHGGFRDLGLMKPRERARAYQRLPWRNELLNLLDLGCRADVLDEQAAFDEQGCNARVRRRFAGLERHSMEELHGETVQFRLDQAALQMAHVFCVP